MSRERELLLRTEIAKDMLAKSLVQSPSELAIDAERAAAMVADAELMKEIIFDFAHRFTAMARHYAGKKGHKNRAEYEKWANLAVETASKGAPFQSPRFSAMMVGATTINKVEVVGGMPDDFAAPQGIPTTPLPAGTTIEAEEDYVSPLVAPSAPAAEPSPPEGEKAA